MINRYSICIVVLFILLVSAVNCGRQQLNLQNVTFEQLLSSPEKYNGKHVTIEGFYFSGFEVCVLSEILDYSGYAKGHLVPKGGLIWVEGGIPQEVYEGLYQQQMMGPTERYGKIKVSGKFQYGGRYGHLGGHSYQLIPSQVELLPWSPSSGLAPISGGNG